MATNKPLILILCSGNSCRSQMAKGILSTALEGNYEVRSASSAKADCLHPLAILVMAEIGIDISTYRSKHWDEFLTRHVETVITVCGQVGRGYPQFSDPMNRYHWGFDDPAIAEGSEAAKLKVFRRVRDEMQWIFVAYAADRHAQDKGLNSP